MMEFAEHVWPVLARTTIAAALTGTLAWLLMRLFRMRSPAATRCICCAVLAQGWLVWQIDVPLPASIGRRLPALGRDESMIVSVQESHLRQPDAVDEEMLVVTPPERPPMMTGNSPAPRDHRHSISTTIAAAWGMGLLCLSIWTVVGYAVLCRRIRRLPPADRRWEAEWHGILSRLRIDRSVRMLQSAGSGPLLCRTLKETVLVIPRSRWRVLSASQREAVLLHEAAHLRRADLAKSLLIRLLAAPQWFNPLAWWAVRRFDDAAEWACDDFAESATSHPVVDYARALVCLSTRGHRLQLTISAASGHGLSARIRRLLSPTLKEESGMKSGILGVTIVLLTGVCVLRPQAAADQNNAPPTTAVAVGDTLLTVDAGSVNQTPTPSESDTAVAVPTASAYESIASGGREAVVDMQILFHNDPGFQADRERLKAEVRTNEVEMQELTAQLRAIRQQLQKLDHDADRDAREALESACDELEATIETRRRGAQRRLLRAESEMYYASYQRIRAAIAEHARENGIRLVRRARSVAEQSSLENRDAPPPEATAAEFDRLDHQAVLELLNRDIVYIEDDRLDITQAVLERLTRSSDHDSTSDN